MTLILDLSVIQIPLTCRVSNYIFIFQSSHCYRKKSTRNSLAQQVATSNKTIIIHQNNNSNNNTISINQNSKSISQNNNNSVNNNSINLNKSNFENPPTTHHATYNSNKRRNSISYDSPKAKKARVAPSTSVVVLKAPNSPVRSVRPTKSRKLTDDTCKR